MTVRYTLTASDALAREMEIAAFMTGTTLDEAYRKALTMYLAAVRGKQNGQKIGLFNAESLALESEFVGL